jgi:hypothetical protein
MIPHPSRLIAALLLLGAITARSQTLNWGSLTGSDIVNSQGDPLDNTFLFELGAFDAGFIPEESNSGEWTAHWNVFDTAAYSYSTEGSGYFTGKQDVQAVSSYSSLFEGMTAYLWIRNGDETERFLATTSAEPGSVEWVFPNLVPGCCPNGEVTTWSVSNLASAVPVWGSQGDKHGAGDYFAPSPYDIQTHIVPEPSSVLLLMLGCGFFVNRRGRNHF